MWHSNRMRMWHIRISINLGDSKIVRSVLLTQSVVHNYVRKSSWIKCTRSINLLYILCDIMFLLHWIWLNRIRYKNYSVQIHSQLQIIALDVNHCSGLHSLSIKISINKIESKNETWLNFKNESQKIKSFIYVAW